ncbi:hypothetical protein DFJ43DRAFT_107621 [Lentinula guzmanii]|uniref:Uncharacterized protein n=1 Tax=Lentinula guzmanii TaxID=2804957 RepID=A0AA38JSQ6_9AGAR|nr:hypothetical protein DFJ43DRAFT_107621 [Lentinula guzmanii]
MRLATTALITKPHRQKIVIGTYRDKVSIKSATFPMALRSYEPPSYFAGQRRSLDELAFPYHLLSGQPKKPMRTFLIFLYMSLLSVASVIPPSERQHQDLKISSPQKPGKRPPPPPVSSVTPADHLAATPSGLMRITISPDNLVQDVAGAVRNDTIEGFIISLLLTNGYPNLRGEEVYWHNHKRTEAGWTEEGNRPLAFRVEDDRMDKHCHLFCEALLDVVESVRTQRPVGRIGTPNMVWMDYLLSQVHGS